MKSVAILNIKGGVGKTVSTVNIGACLSELGHKVLIVDLDPQANATQTFNSYDSTSPSISEVFLDKGVLTSHVIKHTEYPNIDILPSNIGFAFVEAKITSDVTRSQQNRLKKGLAQIKDNYDYCLIDCPPSVGVITINALTAAQTVIVPLLIDQYALDGLNNLMQTIFEVRDEFNDRLQYLGAFITLDESTTVNKVVKETLMDTPLLKLCNTAIRRNVAVKESTFNKKPVVFDKPRCAASIGYRLLTAELLERGL